jgi:hypothetical protein
VIIPLIQETLSLSADMWNKSRWICRRSSTVPRREDQCIDGYSVPFSVADALRSSVIRPQDHIRIVWRLGKKNTTVWSSL